MYTDSATPAADHQVHSVEPGSSATETGNEMDQDPHTHVKHAVSHVPRDLADEIIEVRSPLAVEDALSVSQSTESRRKTLTSANDLQTSGGPDAVIAVSAHGHRGGGSGLRVQSSSRIADGSLSDKAATAARSQVTQSRKDAAVDHVTVPLPPRTSSPGNAPQQEETKGDAAADEDAVAAQPEHSAWDQRDNVQLVEIRNPEGSGWSAMSKSVRDYDEEEIKYYKEDIDTLLVFAGLYSAVLSAFIIESYQFLQPDPEDKMVFLFQQMLSQNYTMLNGFLNATNPYPALPKFVAPTWAICVNILWFSSLVVSLAAASYGMLVKQWLREYLDLAGNTSPHERLRARQYRRPALEHWKVFEIAASLPLLLELALGLFFVGLCYFTTEIHPSIGRSTVVLVAAWAFFFLAATIAPLVSPRCPYKTTLLRGSMRRVRRGILWLVDACIPAYAFGAKHTLPAYFACASTIHKAASTTSAFLTSFILRLHRGASPSPMAPAVQSSDSDHTDEVGPPVVKPQPQPEDVIFRHSNIWELRRRLGSHMKEETHALKERQDDIEILQSVEEIMPGDGLLLTVADIAVAAKSDWYDTFKFIRKIVYNRTGRDMVDSRDGMAPYRPVDPSMCIYSLEPLSQQACDALTTWACNILRAHGNPGQPIDYLEEDQCSTLFFSLITSHTRPLPAFHAQTFRRLVFYLPSQIPSRLIGHNGLSTRLDQLFSGDSKWPSDVPFDTWASAMEELVNEGDSAEQRATTAHILSLLVSAWQVSSPSGRPRKGRSPQPFSQSLLNKFLALFCEINKHREFPYVGLNAEVHILYGILLGSARADEESWERTSQLSTCNLTSILNLDSFAMYHWDGSDTPSSPKTAFLSLMKRHSATWIPTVLGWLAPGRMPGNILAEIVAADIGSSGLDEQLRKVDGIIDICRVAALESQITGSTDHEIDLSSLLQIVILLEREHLFRLHDESSPARKKVPSVQDAFRLAVIRRHVAYRILIVATSRVLRQPIPPSPELLEKYESRLSNLVGRMRRERLDLVYAIGFGCRHGGNWAGAVNQRFAPGEGMRLVVGRDLDSASQALEATSIALRSTEQYKRRWGLSWRM